MATGKHFVVRIASAPAINKDTAAGANSCETISITSKNSGITTTPYAPLVPAIEIQQLVFFNSLCRSCSALDETYSSWKRSECDSFNDNRNFNGVVIEAFLNVAEMSFTITKPIK